MNIRVQCYAGHRGEEEPRALFLEDWKIEVTAVLDRWIGPDHRYFKVQGADGGTYLLRHDASGTWTLTHAAGHASTA